MVLVVFVVHDKQYTQIKHFLALEQAKQQQNCLQNVFDAQPDGVIILSKRLKPKKSGQNDTEESSE